MKLWALRGLVLGAVALVTGCGSGPNVGRNLVSPSAVQQPITFSQGATIKAPQGYCPRPDLIKDQGAAAFAAFSSCDGRSNSFLTVSLMQGTLDPSGLPDPLGKNDRVLARDERAGITLVEIENAELTRTQGMARRFWRAVAFDGTQVILANLYAKRGQSLPARRAKSILALTMNGVTPRKPSLQPVSLDKPVPKPKYRP